MDGVAQLAQVIPVLRQIGASLTEADLSRSTPCVRFTVGQVLEHMVGGATAFAPGFRGEPAGASIEPPADLLASFDAAMAELLDAVHSPGASERTLTTPFGEMTGASFARYVALDGLVHGWDLSVATGRDYAPDPALVAAADGYARDLLADGRLRDGDTFAEATESPPAATDMERLAAFTGRDVTPHTC